MEKHIKDLRPFIFIITILFAGSGVLAQSHQTKLANEYYINGDFEKAESLYEKLSRKPENISSIHANYFNLLLTKNDFVTAEKYLSKTAKHFPASLQYKVDFIYLYHTSGQEEKKSNYLRNFKNRLEKNQYQLNIVAQNLVNRELLAEALDFLQEARKINGRPSAFALDMAGIYRQMKDNQSMTEEYLNYAMGNPGNVNYVKNIFQNLLRDEKDLNYLEQTLIKKIQKQPDLPIFSNLLIWVELQRKNFYGAFLQARALDKRMENGGDETMRIGQIALDNHAWEDAITIFQYITEVFADGYNYPVARKLLIRSKEGSIKSKYPVDKLAIRNLTHDYQALYDELGPNLTTLEALRNKALLHAFYLDEKDSAIRILNDIIGIPRVSAKLIATCKLNLGDIHLLIDEPWEATLLYSQVEKAHKKSPLAYEAKLKNAQLNYFTGNFSLAKSHLDILKKATTKEISNDAIYLSILVTNNTAFDTSDLVMQEFASIELLVFQKQLAQALERLEQFVDDNAHHSLADEAYWLQAQLLNEQGKFSDALIALDQILNEFATDILGDDAFFKKAEIYELQLADYEKAKLLYREFLTDYPGSMYAAEARKRFRKLRGDVIN